MASTSAARLAPPFFSGVESLESLKKQCASCREAEYAACLKCRVHECLNRTCALCGDLGAINLLDRARDKLYVCLHCLILLT